MSAVKEAQERFEAARTLIAGDNIFKLAGEDPDTYHALRDALHRVEEDLMGERDDYDPTDDFREDR